MSRRRKTAWLKINVALISEVEGKRVGVSQTFQVPSTRRKGGMSGEGELEQSTVFITDFPVTHGASSWLSW